MKKILLIAIFVVALVAFGFSIHDVTGKAKVAPNAGHVLAGGGPLDGPTPPPGVVPEPVAIPEIKLFYI